MQPLIVLVTGSRSVPVTEWDSIVNDALDETLTRGHEYVVVMHGMCPHPGYDYTQQRWMASVDMLADEWAVQNQVNVLRFPAHWDGPLELGAGPARNRLMVNTARAWRNDGWIAEVKAFHPTLYTSKGTKQCVRYALSKGLTGTRYDGTQATPL